MVAGSSAFARVLRSSTSASETSAPAAFRLSSAPCSISQTSRSSGSRSRSEATAALCPGFSTITATAPESPRIHWICSGELVSYTGTVTPPALQIAKSKSTHS